MLFQTESLSKDLFAKDAIEIALQLGNKIDQHAAKG